MKHIRETPSGDRDLIAIADMLLRVTALIDMHASPEFIEKLVHYVEHDAGYEKPSADAVVNMIREVIK